MGAWGRQQVLMALSISVGYLGFDRFYNQQFWWGVLKASTLGGFFVWWIIDAIYFTARAGRE